MFPETTAPSFPATTSSPEATDPSRNAEEADDFRKQLLAALPKLRFYAISLTHNRDAADDLVQETVAKALRARHSFQPGTNLQAWLFRIQRNQFISDLRAARPTTDIEEALTVGLPGGQETGMMMREFLQAFAKLHATQREALILAVVEGQKLEDIAALTGVAVGTVKSRISRARDALARMLLDEDRRPIQTKRDDRAARSEGEDSAMNAARA